ncbi:MAG: hypothetical protein CBD36_000175 [Candidatus Puniceispirillum sp. TMED176]|nr:MAG: hypothetical protein CBD36_000175 [Candidatus Puniceispirillum sp. TMED176]
MDAMADSARTSSGRSQGGDLAGVDLGADSETLALFASLFAMMQVSQPDDAAAAQDGVEEASPATSDPAAQTPLPAAAMLMAARGLGSGTASGLAGDDSAGARDMTAETVVDGDATHLVRLLLTARDIAMPAGAIPAGTIPDGTIPDGTIPDGAMPDEDAPAQPGSGQNSMPVGTSKTATEMLTGAIEILRSLEAVGAPDDGIVGAAEIIPVSSMQGQLSLQHQVMAGSSAEFVGPMPAVTMPTLVAPSAGFVGPMPAVTMPVLGAPSAGFVGPMPAVTMPVLGAPLAEFVGPMPAAAMTIAGSRPAGLAQPATSYIIGGEAGARQADGLSSPVVATGDGFESAEGELRPADMAAVRKEGRAMNGGRDLFANTADGQSGKGSRQMAETPAPASQSLAATLKQSAAQGTAHIMANMPAKQTAQPVTSNSTAAATDPAGQSNASQTGNQTERRPDRGPDRGADRRPDRGPSWGAIRGPVQCAADGGCR